MKSYETGASLNFIRRELDSLVGARSLGGLTPIDERRYRELCRQECDLLERMGVRTPFLISA
jgi:hypothetical protein